MMDIKDLKLKATNRAILIYEQIMGTAFKMDSLTDQYVYYYSTILANNPDVQITFDEFLEELDNDPEALPYFINWFTKELQIKEKIGQKKN